MNERRAPDLATIARFADLLQATARTEMDLHRGYAAQFGITTEALEREPMAPTTRGYTDFLLRVAALVAVAFVIIGGFKYMTAQGEPAGVKSATQTLVGALVGLVIAIIATAVVSFIGNRLG